ncbi:sensor histidine kinase [Duganella violaceipulchra]|uniref:HAMP domain-containing histidine kinase n=1 Tax=Duganella violaceipulchra TaxID=2849652 RepID=A0AA41HJT5_9BURK|nr:HAMP domain-containing sensor histidine kinase [Duganella violaceicalia]MBV6325461.1 HAMP domain-containing histidine kinase [Duganella violaceicalia]MCP2012637.1 signal transduction histidine kinase [Duganella violaceicalia]
MDSLMKMLRDERFMPHGHCFLWFPELLWTSVVADTVIALAYMTIPVTLIYFIRKRRDIPFDWMFGAFGVFILACGTTHLLDIWTIWHPDYWLLALVKVITAIASLITAILLIKLVPVALQLPSPSQLRKVNDDLRNAQTELVATARKAGMAEIATNVLHNVGNVLNSVNVSANLVIQQVSTSKVRALGKVVHLLQEHEADLGHFFSHDEKGKQLPDYLSKLEQAIAVEQLRILDELGELTKSIEHIKEVVATQQSYAGPTGIIESVQIVELVEDALRMSDDSLSRHDITLVKEFVAVPKVLLDRNKVLQILLNLINNAKHAMSGASDQQHRITVRLSNAENAGVVLQVVDNGEGIAPENLTRIFAHGFTTRKNGHGFGLHSCVLAAQSMGATLLAHSEGAGKGATFTLKLPIQADVAAGSV